MNVFLIGYRCSGKTTVGKSIAMTIDWSFVDSDLLIIKKNGNSIKDIIDTAVLLAAAMRRTGPAAV